LSDTGSIEAEYERVHAGVVSRPENHPAAVDRHREGKRLEVVHGIADPGCIEGIAPGLHFEDRVVAFAPDQQALSVQGDRQLVGIQIRDPRAVHHGSNPQQRIRTHGDLEDGDLPQSVVNDVELLPVGSDRHVPGLRQPGSHRRGNREKGLHLSEEVRP